MVPLLAWLRGHQFDLMTNKKRHKHSIVFEVDFNNHETVDLSIKLDLTEHLAEIQHMPAYADESETGTTARRCWPNGARPRRGRERRPADQAASQRRAINRKVAIDLRRSQAQRIKAQQQQGPDGAAYPARKRRKEFKGKNGRIKRQKAAMFAKIRTAKDLKAQAGGDQIEVGFFGWVARVVQVHQFGQPVRVTPKGAVCKYPERPFLGLSEPDRTLIRESLLRHMEKNQDASMQTSTDISYQMS